MLNGKPPTLRSHRGSENAGKERERIPAGGQSYGEKNYGKQNASVVQKIVEEYYQHVF